MLIKYGLLILSKAGFLSGKPKSKPKKQVEEIEEIITPKARAQIKEENPLILPEVQEQMKKELTNDDFLSSYGEFYLATIIFRAKSNILVYFVEIYIQRTTKN